jgi:CAAX protease family protein
MPRTIAMPDPHVAGDISADRPVKLRRVLQFPLTRIVVAAIPLGVVMAMTDLSIRALGVAPGTMASSLLVVAGGLVSVALYAGYVRLIERRSLVELTGGRAAGELTGGFVIGLGLFLVTAGLLVLVGVGRIERGDGFAAIAPWLLWVAGTATAEEILFRGVIFRIVEERLGSWIALAISALLFGGLHAANANASVASTFAIAIEAGVLLAAAYMASRRLWLPIALHAGWNFAQLGLLGVQRPGHSTRGAWLSHFTGPPLLTGGDWGPEISIVALVICLVASILLLAIAQWRGRTIAPFWARAK